MKVYIGWDPREVRAYNVAEASIIAKSNFQVAPVPLKLADVAAEVGFNRRIERKDGRLWCPISEAPMATEFAISRFCTPFLAGSGMALFIDADMLCVENVRNMLYECKDSSKAVWVVKHENLPQEGVKMDNQLQVAYRRKNWSSVMLWNVSHPANRRLTMEMVNTLPGRDLHAFCWLKDEEIGELDQRWNQLVGVHNNAHPGRGGILHYTLGGPWFEGYEGEWDEYWLNEERDLLAGASINCARTQTPSCQNTD